MKLPDFRYQCGDALEFMADMPDNSVKLILTSPPYNMGKAYEARTSIDEYLDNILQVYICCQRGGGQLLAKILERSAYIPMPKGRGFTPTFGKSAVRSADPKTASALLCSDMPDPMINRSVQRG